MNNDIKDNLLLEFALNQFTDYSFIEEKYIEGDFTGHIFSDIKLTYEGKTYKVGIDSIMIKDKFDKEYIKNNYYFICFELNHKNKFRKRVFEFNLKDIEEIYPLQLSRLITMLNQKIKNCNLPIREILD